MENIYTDKFTSGEFEFGLGKYDLNDIKSMVGDKMYDKLNDDDLEKFKDIIFYDVHQFITDNFMDYLQDRYGVVE